jgi:LacI family transcriptional regulator
VSETDYQALLKGDGVLFEDVLSNSERVSPRGLPIPAVGMQNIHLLDRAPVVCSDNLAVGRMAAQYLSNKGLTRLAYVSYNEGNFTEAGFREAAEAQNSPVQSYYLGNEKPELDSIARRRLLDWFEALPPTTGVLFRDDYLAYKVMDWLPPEWIPERLGLLGIGNDPLVCEITRPTLSSIEREGQAIGRKAAELLHRMMEGETVERRLHLMPPGHVVERQTTGLDFTADPLVTRALRLMVSRLEDPQTLPELCRSVGASRRTLERRFSDVLGMTVWEQHRHLQIRRAKDLLRNSDKPLNLVSDRCGFTNPQQFSKVFHKAVGVTPRDYRRGL